MRGDDGASAAGPTSGSAIRAAVPKNGVPATALEKACPPTDAALTLGSDPIWECAGRAERRRRFRGRTGFRIPEAPRSPKSGVGVTALRQGRGGPWVLNR